MAHSFRIVRDRISGLLYVLCGPGRRPAPAGLLLLFILLTGLLFGRTLFPPEGSMIYGGDIYDAYFYWKGYMQQSFGAGTIPFWNPYNFSGTPFLAHPNINIAYPFNWLFILLPSSYSFAWYFFLHVIIAGISMYILVRDFTGRWGAAAAAVMFAWGGFFAARIYSGHLEYVDAASWVPLTAALLFRVIRAPTMRNILLASMGVGIQLVVGNELFFLFAMEIAGLFFIYQSVLHLTQTRHKIAQLGRSLLSLIIPVLLGFSLAAIGVLPRLQFIRESIRSAGLPYDVAATGSLPFSGLLLFLRPYFWGNPFPQQYSYHGPWPNLFEFYHYLGIVPVILLCGFVISFLCVRIYISTAKIHQKWHPGQLWWRTDIWFFLFVILAFCGISFGSYLTPNIHEMLWKYTPFYGGIRFPARHLFVVALSLCVVSGIIVGQWKSKWIGGLLIVCIAVDLFFVHAPFIRVASVPTAIFDHALVASLKADTGLYRVLPDFSVVSRVRRDMDFGAAALYKISSTSDYNSMIVGRYYRFIDLINGSAESSLRAFNVEIPPPDPNRSGINFLNVKYVLFDRSFDTGIRPSDRFVLKSQGERYQLFENTQHLPRFFVVHTARVFTDEKQLESAIRNNTVDFSSEIALSADTVRGIGQTDFPCTTDKNSRVSVNSYAANHIRMTVDAPCDGFLSSSEVYYSGWKARIDGVQTPVLISNYAFRAIRMPKGNHVVEYYYEPTVFYIGGFITVLSIVLMGYGWKRYR